MNIYTDGICGNVFPHNKNGFWTNVAKLWSSYDNKTTELIQRAILFTGFLLFFVTLPLLFRVTRGRYDDLFS